MPFLAYLNALLSCIVSLNHPEITRYLVQRSSRTMLISSDEPLLEITPDHLLLTGRYDLTTTLTAHNHVADDTAIDSNQVGKFFRELNPSIIRLNHLGVDYSCVDIEEEIARIRAILQGTPFTLFEDMEITDKPNRWFFIGDLKHWDQPLFELVLTQSAAPLLTKWSPHFQIDLDTTLSMPELQKLTAEYLKPQFFDWQLDIPNLGAVLGMGELANLGGTKVYLGLGTNLRKTKWHRTTMLQPV